MSMDILRFMLQDDRRREERKRIRKVTERSLEQARIRKLTLYIREAREAAEAKYANSKPEPRYGSTAVEIARRDVADVLRRYPVADHVKPYKNVYGSRVTHWLWQ